MLNNTLNKKTFTLLAQLRESRPSTFKAISGLLIAERTAALEVMAEADDEKVMYRAQGAAEQLKELNSLFESLDSFEGLFTE